MNESWTMTREEMISEMISLDEGLQKEAETANMTDWLRELEEDEFSAEYEETTGNVVTSFDGMKFGIY